MKRNRKGKKTIEIKWGKMEKRRWAGRVEKKKRRKGKRRRREDRRGRVARSE
jgi:hypothetical protein